jgi:GntR family transcriptional regulator
MTDWSWAQTVNPKDALPLHAQIERSIRVAIASRRLQPGDQLPTVRQLAVELRINVNTVAKVYTHLERSGVLETRRGVGTFVVDGEKSHHNQAARHADIRAVAMRAIADASVRGFSAADLRRELQTISKEQRHGSKQ